jgi:hypothetical protein
LQEGSKPFAASDMGFLHGRTQIARRHVIDQALAKRADCTHTHGKLLSELSLTPHSRNRVLKLSAGLWTRVQPGSRRRREYRVSDLGQWLNSGVREKCNFGLYPPSRHERFAISLNIFRIWSRKYSD